MSSALTTAAARFIRSDILPRLDDQDWALISFEDYGNYEHSDAMVSNLDGTIWIFGIMEDEVYRILIPTGTGSVSFLPTDELTEGERNMLFTFVMEGVK